MCHVITTGAPLLDPKLSADGRTVAFVCGDEVYVTAVDDDAAPRRVTAGAREIEGVSHGVADYVAQARARGGSLHSRWFLLFGTSYLPALPPSRRSRRSRRMIYQRCPSRHNLSHRRGAQEELERADGFWLSPRGAWLAYEEVDERHIPAYRITHQGEELDYTASRPSTFEEHRYSTVTS